MDSQLLYSLLPVELVISIFAIIVAYFVISLPKTYKLKFILIPIFVVGSFFVFTWFEHELGYPVSVTPKETIVILNYRVIAIDNKKNIELWTLPDGFDSRSRLIAIPWTKETEKQLKSSVRGRRKGEITTGQMDENKMKFRNVRPPWVIAPKKR